MPLVILACRVLESMIQNRGIRENVAILSQPDPPSVYLDYGLHRTPQLMAPTLQKQVDAIAEPSTILVGYGLCGNGLVGLAARQHTLVIPRADDCITLLLGSYERYLDEFNSQPGTYYLTKGWLESGSNPLKEYRNLLERYDSETADWILDEQYHAYKRIIFVAHDAADLEAYRPLAREVAEFCAHRWGYAYEERVGSLDYVRRFLIEGPVLTVSTEDFVVIPPGGMVQADMFWRNPK